MVRLHLLNRSAGMLTDHLPHRALCALLLVCLALGPAPPRAHAQQAPVTRLTDDGRSYTRLGLGWSPDGTHILFLKQFDEGDQLWVARADGTETRPVSKLGWQSHYSWSPNSEVIVYSYAEHREPDLEGSLQLYNVQSGESRQLRAGLRWAQLDCKGYETIEWSADSRRFALLVAKRPDHLEETDSCILDMATGTFVAVSPNHYTTGDLYPGSWSPNGDRFALVSQSSPEGERRIWVCNRDGSGLHPVTPDNWWIGSDPRWSPSGDWIAFTTTANRLEDEKTAGLCDVWLMRPDGSEMHPITHGSSAGIENRMSFYRPEWTTSGRHIVCQGSRFDTLGNSYDGIYLIDVVTKRQIPMLENDPDSDQLVDGFLEMISLYPEGSRAAFSVRQHTVLGRKTPTPTLQDRRDILYYYDIPTLTLHEVIQARPAEDGVAFWYPGFDWKPLISPDCRYLLFTKARVMSLAGWKFEPDLHVVELEEHTEGTPAAGATPAALVPAEAKATGEATLIVPSNRRASEIADSLPEDYRGIYTVDAGLNALIISGEDEQAVDSLRRDIALLDQPVPQIMVDVLVTELSRDASRQLGLDWEYVRGSLRALLPLVNGEEAGQAIYRGVGTFDKSFFATLAALEEHGQAHVRANPRVLARCGSQATINIRRTDNFFYDAGTDYQGRPVRARSDISADTILRITPHLLASGRIAMQVDATVDSFIFGGRDELPDTTRRQATTDVVCADGESIVIGGLTQEEETTKRQKTPLLGDIPLLGQLFRHTTRSTKQSTLVIFITPHLIGGGETAP